MAVAAEGADQPFFRLSGEFLFETQNDRTVRAASDDEEINDLYITIEPYLSLGFGEYVSLEAGLILEPVAGPQPGADRYIEDEGLCVEELYLRYANERWGVRAGKFNPTFGVAWDVAPGIYGVDFAEDYELTERIGGGGFVRLGDERYGFHRFAADLFFADTSFLSGSGLHDRGRLRRSDGGPSNTGDPRSFALALEGEEIPRLTGMTYHLAFSRQKVAGAARNQYGYAAGLSYAFAPTDDVEIQLLSEYVHQRGVEGERLQRHYYTQSGAASWRGWNLALSSTLRDSDSREGGPTDHLLQLSAGYGFDFGLSIDVAWRYAREDGSAAHGFGGLIAHTLAF
ncbi:MAG: hypothetical protein QF570_04375 [Myxococcota bacterium]|nr:hypothetical protein [Myxococcota bacterium]